MLHRNVADDVLFKEHFTDLDYLTDDGTRTRNLSITNRVL